LLLINKNIASGEKIIFATKRISDQIEAAKIIKLRILFISFFGLFRKIKMQMEISAIKAIKAI